MVERFQHQFNVLYAAIAGSALSADDRAATIHPSHRSAPQRPPRCLLASLRSWLIGALFAVILAGCGASVTQSRPPASTAATPPASATTAPVSTPAATQQRCAPFAPATIAKNSNAHTIRSVPFSSDPQPQAATPTTLKASFDAQTNTITVTQGSRVTLKALQRVLGASEALRELAPGEWLLSANLVIARDAQLQISAPEVRWLKLRSNDESFVSIKAIGGSLDFADTCVTSWDEERNTIDQTDTDGRSFVLARDGARMNIRRSELSYLGYFANESYGVAWRLPGTTGEIIDSVFGYNFYGLYAYEASNLVIRGNDVHNSTRYGIDPHTRSNNLLIENNIAHHNGKQGIILAEECSNSIIRNNVAFNNVLHGIVIYQRSNNNVVENNISYGNGLQGININDSSGNTIRNNTVYGNTEDGIGVALSAMKNTIVGNTSRKNGQDGIALYSAAQDNIVQANIVQDNQRYGIYVKSAGNQITSGNVVSGNRIGVYLNIAPAPQLAANANRIENNIEANVQTTTP